MSTIASFILGLGKRIEGPTFIKDFEDSSSLINELQVIADTIKDEAVKDEIDMDIGFIKAGDYGEKNVYYELKNSFIPMLVLHNVVIQYDDYKAQMDYILITNKFVCILETKKLNGNITINNNGDFIRSFINKSGKVYKKEGMYSPISQNQRHVRILENLLKQEKVIKKTPVMSLVVMANPKSIIDFKFAKKEIKEQIIKHDQLTPRIKKMLEAKSDVNLIPSNMTKIADFLMENHVELENAFVQKYKQHVTVETKDLTSQQSSPIVADSLEKQDGNSKSTDSKTSNTPLDVEIIREALVKYRLDQSRKENIKAYFIFNNKQLDDLLDKMPSTPEELMNCEGFGAGKVGKYGNDILSILKMGNE